MLLVSNLEKKKRKEKPQLLYKVLSMVVTQKVPLGIGFTGFYPVVVPSE